MTVISKLTMMTRKIVSYSCRIGDETTKISSCYVVLFQERPVSLKKSIGPGRVTLNSLKDGQSAQSVNPVEAAASTKSTFKNLESRPFSPRYAKW